MKILCLPGWACLEPIDSWFGHQVETWAHIRQMEPFLNQKQWPEIEGPWSLVTWSMGTWSAMDYMLKSGNYPKRWLALSPFIDFVSSESLVTPDAHRVLLQSFVQNPWRTLDFFARKQGSGQPWFRQEEVDQQSELLAQSLKRLGEPWGKEVPRVDDIVIIRGLEDRIVSSEMALSFSEKISSSAKIIEVENLDHAIFYEQPEELSSIVQDWLQ